MIQFFAGVAGALATGSILLGATDGSISGAGKWEGEVVCGGVQRLPVQVLIALDPDAAPFGVIVSPSQGFASALKSVRVEGPVLTITAEVPNNAVMSKVTVSGHVTDSTWEVELAQGDLRCPGSLQLASEVKSAVLGIAPSYQSQPMWCWLTAGEMVFRHYGVLDTRDPAGHASQCKILASIMQGGQNAACSRGCDQCGNLGGGSSREVSGMLSDYPRRMMASGQRDTPRIFSSIATTLTPTEVISEVQAGNPIIIGISPGDQFRIARSMDPFFPPMHVALIVGYITITSSGTTWYLVNDPYPLPLGPTNPYVRAGGIPLIATDNGRPVSAAYWITAENLKAGLTWTESILVRSERRSE